MAIKQKYRRRLDFEHAILTMAMQNQWKVLYVQKQEMPSGTFRRLTLRKTGHPTIKIAFIDDRLVGAARWYYGERMSKGTLVKTEATVKKWLRARSW